MNGRRDFLACAAGAVTAGAVLPPLAAATLAYGKATGVIPHPDADLIRICAEHIATTWSINNHPPGLSDDDPLWVAYNQSCDFISETKPRTLEGILAKARAAKAAGTLPDGTDDEPCDPMAEYWAWDLVKDLVALGGTAS